MEVLITAMLEGWERYGVYSEKGEGLYQLTLEVEESSG
jgi:hypothetical protein